MSGAASHLSIRPFDLTITHTLLDLKFLTSLYLELYARQLVAVRYNLNLVGGVFVNGPVAANGNRRDGHYCVDTRQSEYAVVHCETGVSRINYNRATDAACSYRSQRSSSDNSSGSC